ncbi:SAM-dependent methyltransferase [Streptosporangium sp. NPDC050855]|uniref:SAM-dependent methyltransferase n=1 Tax=Streptosporangium sp. NPDC050855 TaxID=3366194 RepID=UPI003791FE7B
MEDRERAPGIDPSKANPARMYDYYIGGNTHYPADIAAAEAAMRASPYVQKACRENRHFLRRVVRFMRGEGIRQFLDIGAGLPTAGNVHELAPDARVVYVDNDPVVLIHAQTLMSDGGNVRVVEGDARTPGGILSDPTVREFLDWDEPIGLLMIGLLHFVADADDPYGAVREFRDALPAGSHVGISHGTAVGFEEYVESLEKAYSRASASPSLRPLERIVPFLDGLEVVEPGVVPITTWHPDGIAEGLGPDQVGIYGGVGRVRSPAA